MVSFFTDDEYFTGPPLTDEMVHAAGTAVGYRLPRAYLDLLFERNGGTPIRRCFPMTEKTSWSDNHIEILGLRGIGGSWGIDNRDGLGSADMIAEWRYPEIGVVICEMPSAGHDAVMLDYRTCGPEGEPQVVYIGDNRSIHALADNFADFIARLISCSEFKRVE